MCGGPRRRGPRWNPFNLAPCPSFSRHSAVGVSHWVAHSKVVQSITSTFRLIAGRFMSKYIVLTICGAALLFIGLGVYVRNSTESIQKHPKMYCYDTFRGPINSALYIESLRDSADFLQYYHIWEKGGIPVGNFPLNGLDPDSPVFVQRYVGADSALAEVVNYYQSPLKSRPYMLRCYVYSHTLHASFPKYRTQ